jgi:hypothetical protein
MQAGDAKAAGTIKGKVKRDPGAAGKIGKAKSAARRPDQAEVNIKGRFTGQAGKRMDASIDRAVKQVKASEQARLMKPKAQVKAERAARAEANRQSAAAKPKRTRTAESQRISRAKQVEKRRSITTNPAGERASAAAKMAANAARTQQRATAFLKATAKPASTPRAASVRRKAVGKISEAKAGRIISRIDANRPGLRKASGSARKTANAIRTQRGATDFALAAGARARKKGQNLSVNQSLQRAVANAAKKPKRMR